MTTDFLLINESIEWYGRIYHGNSSFSVPRTSNHMTMQIVFLTSWIQFIFSNKISYIYLLIMCYELITPYRLKNLKYWFQHWTKNLVRSEKSFPMIRIHARAFLLKQYPGVGWKIQHKRNWWYTTRARIKLMQSLVCFYDVKKCKCTSYNEMFNWTWL